MASFRAIAKAVLLEPLRMRTWRESIYNVLAFPLGLLWFIVFTTLLALGVGLVPLALSGLVVLFITLLLAQGAATVERELAGALLNVPTDAPVRRQPSGRGPVAHFWARIIDPVTWKELIYLFLCFPMGMASFTAAVMLWSTVIFGLTSPLWNWAFNTNPEETTALWIRGEGDAVEVILNVITGALVLFLAPWVMRVFALLREAMVRVLLGRTREQELEHEVERLADSRALSVDAATTERQRIERDLHDGAQARLVSLAINLGRARERLDREAAQSVGTAAEAGASQTQASGDETAGAAQSTSGVSEAAMLVAEAHEDAKRALAEMRDLARGIHPTVLTDRGLDAALSSMAARCPVPVTLDVDLPERPSHRVETVAYFVLSELLTNVARHSHARSAQVTVSADGARLRLVVRDDGSGGATPAQGTGLAGLHARVQSLDGTMEIASPPGGPTVVSVNLPFR